MRKFKKYYTIKYNNVTLDVTQGEYIEGNRIALTATIHETGEPYATLTTNIPAYNKDLGKKDIILDCNNIPGIDKALKEAGLIGKLVSKVQSGYCVYPVYRYLG